MPIYVVSEPFYCLSAMNTTDKRLKTKVDACHVSLCSPVWIKQLSIDPLQSSERKPFRHLFFPATLTAGNQNQTQQRIFGFYRAFSSSGISVRNRDKAETIILLHYWSFNVTQLSTSAFQAKQVKESRPKKIIPFSKGGGIVKYLECKKKLSEQSTEPRNTIQTCDLRGETLIIYSGVSHHFVSTVSHFFFQNFLSFVEQEIWTVRMPQSILHALYGRPTYAIF